MFVSEPVSLINDHNLKLTVFNTEGNEYPLEISSSTIVEQVKAMAVGHFFGHLAAVGGSHGDDRSGAKDSKVNGSRTYRLVVLQGARPLSDVNSLHFENLIDNDVLLLVERREPPSPSQDASPEDISSPTLGQINDATKQVPKRNDNRDQDTTNPPVDFQVEFRQILVTMIEASVRLISADPDSKEVFIQVLDKLDRRHRPRVDRVALQRLTEMGFVESKATKALQVKRNFDEAVEWLLEEGNTEENDLKTGEESGDSMMDSCAESMSVLEDREEDPAKKILKQFLQYRRKWFQPNQQILQRLSQFGYPEERVIDALRVAGNKESLARELLIDEKELAPDGLGLKRNSPIISAILASPVIQLALPKAKTLLALMMLYESPNNANMWLSDPDTHPVVSQVLRIYHAEKHSLNSRPMSPSIGPTEISDSNIVPSFTRSSVPPRTNSPAYRQFSDVPPSHLHEENQSIGDRPNVPWLSSINSSPISLRESSTLSSPIPTSHVHSIPNSSPIPDQEAHIIREEPMSHSGSPVRGIFQSGSSMANGGPQQVTVNFLCNENPDIEMDETG